MLAIRMQRTGRKGHAMFRVIVQDSRRTPTSGKIVALIGSYDPHTKAVVLSKDKAAFYLEHGAQPSGRVVKLLVSEGIKLPDWVEKPSKDKKRTIRNVEKLRRNRPEEPAEKVEEKSADAETVDEAKAEEAKQETAAESEAPETAKDESKAETEMQETEKPAVTTETHKTDEDK